MKQKKTQSENSTKNAEFFIMVLVSNTLISHTLAIPPAHTAKLFHFVAQPPRTALWFTGDGAPPF